MTVRGDGGENYGEWTVLGLGSAWLATTTGVSIYRWYLGDSVVALAIACGSIFIPVCVLAISVGLFEIGKTILSRLF
jgi:hypothetical protein